MSIPQSNPKASFTSHRSAIEAAVARVLESGWYILGEEVSAFEMEFARAMRSEWAAGVANGTDAIELALRAVGVEAGDGVVTVSHTAVATIAAIARIGARPLFVDIDPLSYTMSPGSLESVLASQAAASARAVVVVHLYGQAADMPALMALAQEKGLPVVEDCAQAHGALLDGRPVGTWGNLGCFSFYPTKNLGALGDGGAVIGSDRNLEKQVRLLREYGWRARYISDTIGFNSRLDELQAAILREKLPFLSFDNDRRRAVAQRYGERLSGLPIVLPFERPGSSHVFHQYVIRTHARDELRRRLGDCGIGTLIHYPLAVHQQPAFSAEVCRPAPLPHTESIVGEILSLPMYPELAENDIESVCLALQECVACCG